MSSVKWYKTKRWQKLRARYLAQHPYCECEHHRGRGQRADDVSLGGPVVDHKEPHRGDSRLFWNINNLQTMTKECHDRFKQSQERGGQGFLKGCDENGMPLSSEHHWSG